MACLPAREFGFTGKKTEANMQPKAAKCNMQVWTKSVHILLQLDSKPMRSSHRAQCAFERQYTFGTWSIALLAALSEPHINYLPKKPELQHAKLAQAKCAQGLSLHKRYISEGLSKDMIGRGAKASEASLHGVPIFWTVSSCDVLNVERVSLFNRTQIPQNINKIDKIPQHLQESEKHYTIHKLLLHTAWVASSSWISKGSPPEMAQSNTIFHQSTFLASENPVQIFKST